jgi:hypothetical protein
MKCGDKYVDLESQCYITFERENVEFFPSARVALRKIPNSKLDKGYSRIALNTELPDGNWHIYNDAGSLKKGYEIPYSNYHANFPWLDGEGKGVYLLIGDSYYRLYPDGWQRTHTQQSVEHITSNAGATKLASDLEGSHWVRSDLRSDLEINPDRIRLYDTSQETVNLCENPKTVQKLTVEYGDWLVLDSSEKRMIVQTGTYVVIVKSRL